jgi:hypothetical protein
VKHIDREMLDGEFVVLVGAGVMTASRRGSR